MLQPYAFLEVVAAVIQMALSDTLMKLCNEELHPLIVWTECFALRDTALRCLSAQKVDAMKKVAAHVTNNVERKHPVGQVEAVARKEIFDG